jgi:hypothetical protein
MQTYWEQGGGLSNGTQRFPFPPITTPYGSESGISLSKEQEMEMLKNQATMLQNHLDQILKRIEEREEKKE